MANLRGVSSIREERRPGGGEALPRREEERGGKLFGRIPRQLAARRGELAHSGSKQIGPRGGRDRLGGMLVGRELGPDVLGPLDAGREHARLVGELELHPPVPDGVEPHAQLMPAARRRGRRVIGAQGLVAQQRGVEGAMHGRSMLAPILDELGVGLNAEPVEQRERRRPQQLREPAVEGPDLDRSARRRARGPAASPSSGASASARAASTPRSTSARTRCSWVERGVEKSASHWSSRSRISPAAARVKVIARISCGGVPSSSARSMRETSIQVLPEPAHASTTHERAGSHAAA